MGAISISRQMGSRGDELARQVAERLKWGYICHEVINWAAQAAGVPQVALAEIDELGFFNLRPSAKERQAYQSQVEHIIRELASEGYVVIVGRGGQVILQDWPDVLHVRVVAPLETRVAWLQQEKSLSAEAARARLAKSDRTRLRYLWRNYGQHLDDPTLYHLILNMGRFDLPQAVNLVVQTYQAFIQQP
ncbi:MAG: cytidylate kinase-like family protein [Anaerolineae bacterium]|nr:cytidylate kinase-like family protein [Anaerolineae bacterium]